MKSTMGVLIGWCLRDGSHRESQVAWAKRRLTAAKRVLRASREAPERSHGNEDESTMPEMENIEKK
jgi:hypothetical protein